MGPWIFPLMISLNIDTSLLAVIIIIVVFFHYECCYEFFVSLKKLWVLIWFCSFVISCVTAAFLLIKAIIFRRISMLV